MGRQLPRSDRTAAVEYNRQLSARSGRSYSTDFPAMRGILAAVKCIIGCGLGQPRLAIACTRASCEDAPCRFPQRNSLFGLQSRSRPSVAVQFNKGLWAAALPPDCSGCTGAADIPYSLAHMNIFWTQNQIPALHGLSKEQQAELLRPIIPLLAKHWQVWSPFAGMVVLYAIFFFFAPRFPYRFPVVVLSLVALTKIACLPRNAYIHRYLSVCKSEVAS